MVDPKFNTIATRSGECDFSLLETWQAYIQRASDTIHIGVLGSAAAVEDNFNKFVDRKDYRGSYCDFVLVTEAGEILASCIADEWQLHSTDVHASFRRPVEDPEKYKAAVYEFIENKINESNNQLDRSEIQSIVQVCSRAFVEAVAKSPKALDELDWRDVERTMAEAFEGIGFKVELTPPSKDGGKDIILECIATGHKHSYIVEIKHWRSTTKVGPSPIRKFFNVIVKECRNAGVFLSTYGYTAHAIECISEVGKYKIKFGEREKIISLCKTYVDSKTGILVSPDLLPRVLFDGTM